MNDPRAPPDDLIDSPIGWEPSLAFLKYAILCLLAGPAIFTVVIFVVVPDQAVRAIGPVFMMLVALTAWRFLATGKTRTAMLVLVIGIWAVVTGIMFFNGGVRGTLAAVYPLIILIAGWLIGASAAVGVALLTVATAGGFVLAETWNMLPRQPPTPGVLYWVVQSSAFAFAAILVIFLVRSYRNRLAEVRALGSDLAQRTVALQASEADLNRAQAVAHVGSWVYDLATDTMRMSTEASRIYGLNEGVIIGYDTYASQVHPDDRDTVDAAWRTALSGGQSFDREHRIVTGGTIRWVRQRAELQQREDGAPLRCVGTTQDITDRKQAEALRAQLETQLRESQKMQAIGTLAGGIAHDFNNVLATVLGNVELARQDVRANPQALESLEEIHKAGTRARDLVAQILSFSRRQPTQRQPVALAAIVDESVRLLRATLPARLSLEVHYDAAVPAVLADAGQMQQVLINLATNAMQAMRAGPGCISIHLGMVMLDAALAETQPALRAQYASHPGPTVRLALSDTGSGMDEATLARIFEPFFTTKPVGEGTGLGLSVVHGIVREHEGTIVVNSQPGAGTTFTLYLPAASSSVVAPAASGTHTARPIPAPELSADQHILYLDDDESLVFLVKRLLERRGFRVSAHTDQREALATLRAEPAVFDLLLTDYNMPGMSGLDVAREARAIRADLPVAVTSGFIDEALRAQAAEAGVQELIFKASEVEEFCAIVQQLVQNIAATSTAHSPRHQ